MHVHREEITLSPEDLTAVFSSMAEGLMVVDVDNHVEALNQIGGTMLRIAPKLARGLPLSDVLKLFKVERGVQQPWLIDTIFQLDITRIQTWDHVYCKNKAGKVFPITMMITPLLTAQAVSGAVLLFRDATDEVRADEAKSDFVAIASHQLQTPLTAAKLFAEMLSQDDHALTDDQRKEYWDLLRSSIERMIKLINEMLNVSRLEAGVLRIQPEPVDLTVCVRQILKELESVAKTHSCAITFKEPERPFGLVPLDEGLLNQVLLNLVDNAMRYAGGNVCRVAVTVEQDTTKRYFVISVKDNGIGIYNEDRKRIFTKFFRADNARKAQSNGSGLGLYVVKMVVEAWGGTISFISQPDNGTTFSVTIPARGMQPRKGVKQLIQT